MLAEQGNKSGVFRNSVLGQCFPGILQMVQFNMVPPPQRPRGPAPQGTISLLLAVCTLLWVPGTAAKEQSVDNTEISISNNF